MTATTRGDLPHLEASSAQMLQATTRLALPVTQYRAALRRLLDAPTELPIELTDRGTRVRGIMAELRVVDRQPALFAAVLQMADHLSTRSFAGGAPGLAARFEASLAGMTAHGLGEAAAFAETLAVDLGDLIAGDGDPQDVLAELAVLLSTLDVEDPFVLAAFFDALGPAGLQELLAWLYGAPDPYAQLDADAMAAALGPLGTAFANAARLGLIDERFVDQLLVDTTAGNRPDGGRTSGVALLLMYGDPLGTGDPYLTAALASMVLADGFRDATWNLHMDHHRWSRPDGDVLGDGAFNVEAQVARAIDSLVAHPQASYTFLLEPGNQRALLDRAADGWAMAGHAPSDIIEQGLLAFPLEQGWFDLDADGRMQLPHEATSALWALVVEVAGRDRVDDRVARGLANVLAPHGESMAHAASEHYARGPDLLGVDRPTAEAYLANVLRHEAGGMASSQVFAGWTTETFAAWSQELIPGEGVLLPTIPSSYTRELGVIRDQYAMYERALGQANQSYAADHQLLFFAVDEADRFARSRLLREVGWTGGIKGRLASEALGRTTGVGVDALEDAILAAGPGTVRDYQAVLHDQIPNLAIEVAIDAVPPHRRQELVPVPRTTLEVEVDGSWWDSVAPWRDDTRIVQVEPHDWNEEQRLAWIRQNRDQLIASGISQDDAYDWWLDVHIQNISSRFQEPR